MLYHFMYKILNFRTFGLLASYCFVGFSLICPCHPATGAKEVSNGASALEKPFPENIDDLTEIQDRLQSLLPSTMECLVAIEAGDGAGSGVIVSEDGLVLTAAHVIGSTGKKMNVKLSDGREYRATSLGGSELSDAGMLKIKTSESLPYASLSPRNDSKVGDWCFAIGHPGGFDPERGPVVRLGRIIAKQDETMQTDSRLLGGDSGGPLFDFNGKVIAIHSRVSSQPDENFHIPIESFHANWEFFQDKKLFTLESLEQGGFLGVRCEERLNGLEILEVIEDTPAYQAGLLAGDIIKQVDSIKIKTRETLTIHISGKNPGELLRITYERGKKTMSSQIKLGYRGPQ